MLGDDVTVSILAGGALKWDYPGFSTKELNYMTINGSGVSEVTSFGKGSMGEPETLAAFVSYAMKEHPADRTMLVLWNHGNGSQYGLCFDEVYDDDPLTLAELDTAFATLRSRDEHFRLNIVGMDACLMAGFETASVCAPYADYLIASEELEPQCGWDYTAWLSTLGKNPAMTDEELCTAVVRTYQAYCEENAPDWLSTLSAVRLSAIDALTDCVEQVAGSLNGAIEGGHLNTINRMHRRVNIFGAYDNSASDMVDLLSVIDMAAQFDEASAQQAKAALEQAVVISYASPQVPSACGLSIYLPLTNLDDIRQILPDYSAAARFPQYVAFVTDYAESMAGGSYTFAPQSPTMVAQSDMTSDSFLSSLSGVSFIPGVIQSATTQQTGSTDRPSFIPGVPVGSDAPAATAAPAEPSGTIPGFIAGSVSASVSPESITENSLAFSLQVSADELDNLSYAEGLLMMDLSDEDGIYLVDMGYLQNAWIDWNDQTVYSMFDGSWPTLDGQLVVMYDQSVTGNMRRSMIPVTVNGEPTYLIVSFTGDEKTGRILGHNAGYNEHGLPIRSITPLQEGDIIIPTYTMYYSNYADETDDEDMQETDFLGDPITWHSGMTVTYESLKDDSDPTTWQFCFVLNDIFGDFNLSDPIDFVL
ncbi:MAG: clostripain-related cysteine peptidase [Clostridia bacterium]|nr:clostripain-related cysteine peptidase [Clostridia bacterium]